MKFVNDILRLKGHDVWSVTPDTTVFDALRLMADKNIGAVVVLEEAGLAGIFSERDYAREVILKGRSSKEMPVSDIMTSVVATVTPKNSIEECMSLMTNKRIRHLPVLDGDDLVGVVSIGDIVNSIISDQEFTIKQLESYITGSY